MRRRRRGSALTGDPAADARAIDALYGLEPVIEIGATGGDPAGAFEAVACPYCGEVFETAVDSSGGSAQYVEDCQVCCQPIELTLTVTADGQVAGLTASRADEA